MIQEEKIQFKEFKRYAKFLLENKSIFEDLTTEYFRRIRNSNIPILRLLSDMSVEEHQAITTKNIKSFLTSCLDNTSFNSATAILHQWRSNKLLGLPKEKIEISDIVRVYNIRKQLYIDFLHKFTQDIGVFTVIVKELDQFHSQLQECAFQTYVDIHQEILQEENQFISSLIDNSVDGILAFNKNLQITEYNKVLEKWNGVTKEEVIGKELFSVFPDYKDTKEGKAFSKVLNGEAVYIPERPFIHRKGYFEANIVPLFDAHGNITGGIIITHETTKRRETEQELKETKLLLQQITDSIPNVIYIYDLVEQKNIYVNREIFELLGYTKEEIKEMSIEDRPHLIHPDDLPLVEQRDRDYKLLKENQIIEIKGRAKHKNGNWKWIRTRSKVFKFNEQGEPSLILGVSEDITETVQAEFKIHEQNQELSATLEELQAAEELLREANAELEHRVNARTSELANSERAVKEREEQLRLITDAMPVFISYVKKDKTYGFVNQAYENFFNRKKEDIIGKPIWEVIGEKAYQVTKPLIEMVLKGQTIEYKTLLDYSKGKKIWVKISMVPHILRDEVAGYYALVEDITELKNIQLEQERLLRELDDTNKEKEKALKDLEIKNADLQRINTDLDNFIYTASHDLKAPVSNLEGIMSLLLPSLSTKADEKEHKLFDMMNASVKKLHKTILDLVEITKVQKEMEEAEVEPVQFKTLTQDVKEDIDKLIKESDAVIREEYQVEEIYYKKSNLRSIIYNLLSNALKYRSAERKTEITLKTYVENDFIVLSVKDNGLGLSKIQQKKLFMLFKRMHKQIEGTGIGLYTIKRVIENNRGKIEVKSEAGKGTEFLVYLAPTD